MDTGRFPECHPAPARYERLKGAKIGRGFKKAASELIGVSLGCTHISELLGRMATVALQATNRARHKREGFNSDRQGKRLLNTCQAYQATSAVVLRRWPHLHEARKDGA